MKYKYILYRAHYGTGIIDEAVNNYNHILWSAIPEYDSKAVYKYTFGYIDDDDSHNEYEINEEIVKQIFYENYYRMGNPPFMYIAFYNLDTNEIIKYTNSDKMDSQMTEEDFWSLEIIVAEPYITGSGERVIV